MVYDLSMNHRLTQHDVILAEKAVFYENGFKSLLFLIYSIKGYSLAVKNVTKKWFDIFDTLSVIRESILFQIIVRIVQRKDQIESAYTATL